MSRNPVDAALELEEIWTDYRKYAKGKTEDARFDTPETRRLHEACRRTQIALREDPHSEDVLRARGFIGGRYAAAVDDLVADAKAGRRYVRNDDGSYVKTSIDPGA